MFNRLLFSTSSIPGGAISVVPVVDDVSLSERVAAFEAAQGYADSAGGYGGIIPAYMQYGPIDHYFLGRGTSHCRQDDGAQYMLGCECGEVGCWPLMGRVTRLDHGYQWAGFHNPFSDGRDYGSFGPFLFERAIYEETVAQLAITLGEKEPHHG